MSWASCMQYFPHNFPKFHSNIIFPCTPNSSEWSLLFSVPTSIFYAKNAKLIGFFPVQQNPGLMCWLVGPIAHFTSDGRWMFRGSEMVTWRENRNTGIQIRHQGSGSSVSIVIILQCERPGFGSRYGQGGDFLFCHHVQTGSGAHPASYPMGTGGFFSGSKVAEGWNWPLTSI
jgi:hypothetical protein